MEIGLLGRLRRYARPGRVTPDAETEATYETEVDRRSGTRAAELYKGIHEPETREIASS